LASIGAAYGGSDACAQPSPKVMAESTPAYAVAGCGACLLLSEPGDAA
jgi:hypothetical protein